MPHAESSFHGHPSQKDTHAMIRDFTDMMAFFAYRKCNRFVVAAIRLAACDK